MYTSTLIAWPVIVIHISILLTIQSGQCSTFETYSLIYSVYSFIVAGLLPSALMILFGFKTMRDLDLISTRVRLNNNENNIRINRRDYNLMIILMWEVIIYLFSVFYFESSLHRLEMVRQNNIIR